jgi:hypothetical protein
VLGIILAGIPESLARLSGSSPGSAAGEATCVAGLPRPNTAFARITRPIPVNSNATPTMMLKIESISDMNPMSSGLFP